MTEHITYSEIRVVEFDKIGNTVSIFPNPTSDEVNIHFEDGIKDIEVQLFDQVGKLILSEQFGDSNVQETIQLSHLPNGIYLLKVFSENDTFSEKIILQKPN